MNEQTPINLDHCTIIGVQHTEHTASIAIKIAEALLANAGALNTLARCCGGPSKAVLNIEMQPDKPPPP